MHGTIWKKRGVYAAGAAQFHLKASILFLVAEAAVGKPDGVVREVIFPPPALDLRSNNGSHRPALDTLDVIRRAEGEGHLALRTQ